MAEIFCNVAGGVSLLAPPCFRSLSHSSHLPSCPVNPVSFIFAVRFHVPLRSFKACLSFPIGVILVYCQGSLH